jgi:putative phosphoribosyl transferase
MPFRDRYHAGQLLAAKLKQYRAHPNAVVLGLPRGGVPVAYEVATALDLSLDITCPHKIGAPHQPEYAIGAITEHGKGVFNQAVIEQLGISDDYLQREVTRRTQQARERLLQYRNSDKPRAVEGKLVILVDDGLATGSTMKAAISSMQAGKAEKIVVAVPVAPPRAVQEIETLVDEIVCLEMPPEFRAVGQFYDKFDETSDEEVIALLKFRH